MSNNKYGIEPITLESYKWEDWLLLDKKNFILITSERKSWCLTIDYFISILPNFIYKKCISNKQVLNPTKTLSSVTEYVNIGYYVGLKALVKTKEIEVLTNMNSEKIETRIFYLEKKQDDKKEYISKELLQMAHIEAYKGRKEVDIKNIPKKQDIYYKELFIKALLDYSSRWYIPINRYLLEGVEYFNSQDFKRSYLEYGSNKSQVEENIKNKIEYIDRCFIEASPRTQENFELWRGMKSKFNIGDKIGDSVITTNYLSATSSRETAKRFKGAQDGGVLYKLIIDENIPILNMQYFSIYKKEKEYLLPRNLLLIYEGKEGKEKGKNSYIKLRVSLGEHDNRYNIPNNCKKFDIYKIKKI